MTSAEESLNLLKAVSGTVFGSSSTRDLLSIHAKHVCQVLNVDMCVFRKLEGDKLRLLACHGVDADDLNECVDADLGIGHRLIQDKKPIGIEDVETHPDSAPHLKSARPNSFVSYAGTPMMLQGEVLGILGVFVKQNRRHFPDEDLELLFALGSHLAVAIKNHELFTELNAINQDLDKRVQERTHELQSANHELEAFTYTVAHDLRTPLRSIVSNSQILMEDYGDMLPLEAKPLLNRQAESAKRLAAMMDGLLGLTRIRRHEVQPIQLNASRLAEEVALEFIRANNVNPPNFCIEPDIIIGADSRLLRVLFQNLFENAIKFSKQDETPSIRVRREASDASISFVIEDQGIGFDMEYAEKVFMPFERLVRDHEYPGTGIGLASVKRIVEKHGGSIEVQSRPGDGTAFRVRL